MRDACSRSSRFSSSLATRESRNWYCKRLAHARHRVDRDRAAFRIGPDDVAHQEIAPLVFLEIFAHRDSGKEMARAPARAPRRSIPCRHRSGPRRPGREPSVSSTLRSAWVTVSGSPIGLHPCDTTECTAMSPSQRERHSARHHAVVAKNPGFRIARHAAGHAAKNRHVRISLVPLLEPDLDVERKRIEENQPRLHVRPA